MKKKPLGLLAALALCLPGLAPAQTGASDAEAPAPALTYESAFQDYQAWTDISPGDWRASNDAVRAPAGAGAHAGHNMSAPLPPQEQGGGGKGPAQAAPPAHGGHPANGGQK
jgi:hypothetical protein